jgi:hypothetical protein
VVAVEETIATTVVAEGTIATSRKDIKEVKSLEPSALVLLLHQGFFLGLHNIAYYKDHTI